MDLSLCITVRNEKESIVALLESLFTQSRAPEEIVIVDGGSTDGTVQVLQMYAATHQNLTVITLADANVSKGRNVAIANARGRYIACADSGVIYPRDWLAHLLSPFQTGRDVDVVTGYYEPYAQTLFEECVGAMLYPNPSLVDWERFLPTGKSVAFKKEVWEELGGFAEWLPRGIGEDAYFFLMAHKAGFRFAPAPDATCYWRPRRNFAELFRQYAAYSKGAFASGSGSTFVLEAHGANPLKVVYANLRTLLQTRQLLHFCVSVFVLADVGMAKVFGGIAGIIHRRRTSHQIRYNKQHE